MLARMDNFVPIPTNLIYMLDCDCLKVLAILIQKESYWDNKGKLKDGWFVKSISELKAELGCANTKDVGCIIQALVNSGIIEVTAYEKKGMAAKFKISWNKVNELNGMSLYDVKEFEFKPIRKLPRNCEITYNKNTNSTPKSPQSSTICNSTIANKDKRNNKDNTDKRDNNAKEDCSMTNTSTEKTYDLRSTLQKLVCFISYDYPMSKIVQSIHTKTMCANPTLIAMQNKLNGIVSQYGNDIATADICKKLWDELTSTVYETEFQASNSIEEQKYTELVQAVNRIGYAIAYVCKRKYLHNVKALEESSHYFWLNCASGTYKDIFDNYLKWLIAKYTLDESIGETECCKLTKTQIFDRICMANDYFKKGYEEWKANVDRCRTGTHIL